ncbi:MAG: hypothetical protein ACLR8Y_01590 [Alistipes indistinctus]
MGEANYEATTAPTSKLFKGMDEPTMNLVLGRRDLTSETVNDMELGKASSRLSRRVPERRYRGIWKERRPSTTADWRNPLPLT